MIMILDYLLTFQPKCDSEYYFIFHLPVNMLTNYKKIFNYQPKKIYLYSEKQLIRLIAGL